MSLKEKIDQDLKEAMRARDSLRLGAIRLLIAAIRQKEIDDQQVLDETGVVGIIEKLLKQRRDSASQYAAAGRDDLATRESAEADLLAAYLPARLSSEEVAAEVAAALAEIGASGPADMGRAMAAAKQRLAGRADMGEVAGAVKAALAKR